MLQRAASPIHVEAREPHGREPRAADHREDDPDAGTGEAGNLGEEGQRGVHEGDHAEQRPVPGDIASAEGRDVALGQLGHRVVERVAAQGAPVQEEAEAADGPRTPRSVGVHQQGVGVFARLVGDQLAVRLGEGSGVGLKGRACTHAVR